MNRYYSFFTIAAMTLVLPSAASRVNAQAFFWLGATNNNFNEATNWIDPTDEFPQRVPGINDLAIHVGAGPALDITTSHTVDSFRMSGDGSFGNSVTNHTAGTLTVVPTVATVGGENPVSDAGFWIGESGPNTSTYNLNGGTVQLNENFDAFQVARGAGSIGIFNFSAGTININAGSDTNIGLDGTATFNQTAGIFNAAQVHVGHYVSPTATVNLSGSAIWNLGGALLLSDEQTLPSLPNAGNPGVSEFKVTGSGVTIQTYGLGARGQSTLNFIADTNGISPIVQVGGGGVALEDRFESGNFPSLQLDLISYIGPTGALHPNQIITLIDGTALPTSGMFDGLPEGATVPNSGGRRITYGGGDGFDVALVPASQYVPPAPNPGLPNGIVSRWSFDANAGPKPFGPLGDQPVTLDSRVGANEGVIRPRSDVTAAQENLFFFRSDSTPPNTYVTSTDVPPPNMFANGNNGGVASYDAAQSVPQSAEEGALFYPQDIYGNEFSMTNSFSVEAFVKTGSTDIQQILLQGEGFARWGLSMNEGEGTGGIRFFVNDGSVIETIDIGGPAPSGNATYADNEWHYIFATFEEDAGANGFGRLQISVANQDGSASTATRDLENAFFDLPTGSDGNLIVGAEDFSLAVDGDPRRFQGLIDEVQITRGIIGASDRLGALNIGVPGDFDHDGDVDGRDFLLWQRDTSVGNLADWQANYGAGNLVATSTAIPEPSSMLCLLIGMAGLGIAARKI